MVTYEAMAHGLPVLVSPMGAGAVARDGIDGFVIAPSDVDAMIDKLRKLASDVELRNALGEAARLQANRFTWEMAASRRSTEILERLHS
jgi:glycosyltransferase involved in cell wall biosynthesis